MKAIDMTADMPIGVTKIDMVEYIVAVHMADIINQKIETDVFISKSENQNE